MHDAQASVHMVAATVGFVSYGLLWIGALWGVVLKNGWGFTRVRHATIYGIHMVVTLVALTLGVVHALAQLAAPGGTVRLVDVFLPFVNPSDPLGIGLGVIALELFLAMMISVLVQRWLGYHRWQRLHTVGYLAYALVTAHLLISGSETGAMMARVPIVSSLIILLATASVTAVTTRLSKRSRAANGAAGGAVVLNVDPSRCVRYGFCAHEAPELFRLQTDGRLNYRAAVPPEQVERALHAAQACPARAVMLGRRPTAVVMSGERARRDPESDRPDLRAVSGGRMEGRR